MDREIFGLIPYTHPQRFCTMYSKKKKKKKAAQNWLLQCFLLMLNMLLPLERSTLWKFHKLNPGEVKESAQIVWRLTYQDVVTYFQDSIWLESLKLFKQTNFEYRISFGSKILSFLSLQLSVNSLHIKWLVQCVFFPCWQDFWNYWLCKAIIGSDIFCN